MNELYMTDATVKTNGNWIELVVGIWMNRQTMSVTCTPSTG